MEAAFFEWVEDGKAVLHDTRLPWDTVGMFVRSFRVRAEHVPVNRGRHRSSEAFILSG